MRRSLFVAAWASLPLLLFGAEITLTRDDFNISQAGWKGASYWAGKLSRPEIDGRKCLRVESTRENDRVYARVYKWVPRVEFREGTAIRLSIRCKGRGTMTLGLLSYGGYRPNPVDLVPGQPIALTGEMTDHQVEIVAPMAYDSMRPYIELNGEAELVAEKFTMTVHSDPNIRISDEMMQVVSDPAQLRPFVFKTNLPGQTVSGSVWQDLKQTKFTARADADGNVTVVPPPEFKERLAVHVYTGGVTGSAFALRETAEECRRASEIAGRIKLSRPVRMLLIGDSLADFFRGYNFVDRISLGMNANNPGMFSFRNAGVGGDYLDRVQERLVGTMPGMKPAYRQEMYRDLFQDRYDLVLIELGPNDTRSNRSQNYAVPLVPPEKQKRILTYVINFLRRKTKAKIVVLAPSPSDPEANLRRAENTPSGREFVLFGKPELVDAYDRVNREVCAALNVDYIDILSVMRRDPDRASLYIDDGVHLSAKGGRVMAEVILNYLKENFQ